MVIAGCIFVVGLASFVAWGMTPLGPTAEAVAAMESDASVVAEDNGDFVVFTPLTNPPITGFIFYPGGHVDSRSNAPIAREIASRGYLISIVKMPLSLAIFDVNKVDDVIEAYPDTRYWVIGGHSLGGPAAASYAKNNPGKVLGLVFWTSYPAGSDDLSGIELKGLTTFGSNDRVLDMQNFNATVPLLPPGTIIQVIEGGNHSQFGNYGSQKGDGTATISAGEQQLQAADLTVRILRLVEGE